MSFSDHAENLVLDWLLTAGSATRPTAWYVALYTAAPSDAGGGTEVSGGAYARQAVTFSITTDTASNAADIEWDTATGGWGTVTHAAVFDASTSGNMLAWSALAASRAVTTGDVLRIPAGSLTVTLA